MRVSALFSTAAAVCVAASSLKAQEPRVMRIGPGEILQPGRGVGMIGMDMPRAVIGVGTTSGATSRDTLGVLVSTVRPGSPAEKAGIEEGNRIASVNGVNLRLAAADVGDDQMAGAMSRRLGRELDKLRPGDDVDLRLFANGQSKTLKIKTIAPKDLYESPASSAIARDDRATLGINLATTGTSRDTIGVFVMSVEDGGPAAKAGIEEGSRIATVNGVDVRGKSSRDDDEFVFRPTNVSRLEREISRVKPGDDVDLRVYYNGQFRNVKVKAGRFSDLPRRSRSVTITGGDRLAMPSVGSRMGGMGASSMDLRGLDIAPEVRRALESARVFGRMSILGGGNRIQW